MRPQCNTTHYDTPLYNTVQCSTVQSILMSVMLQSDATGPQLWVSRDPCLSILLFLCSFSSSWLYFLLYPRHISLALHSIINILPILCYTVLLHPTSYFLCPLPSFPIFSSPLLLSSPPLLSLLILSYFASFSLLPSHLIFLLSPSLPFSH